MNPAFHGSHSLPLSVTLKPDQHSKLRNNLALSFSSSAMDTYTALYSTESWLTSQHLCQMPLQNSPMQCYTHPDSGFASHRIRRLTHPVITQKTFLPSLHYSIWFSRGSMGTKQSHPKKHAIPATAIYWFCPQKALSTIHRHTMWTWKREWASEWAFYVAHREVKGRPLGSGSSSPVTVCSPRHFKSWDAFLACNCSAIIRSSPFQPPFFSLSST